MTDIYRPSDSQFHSRQKLDPSRCKAGVWTNERWSRYHQCNRKAGKDGWCKQHHPDVEAEKEKLAKEKSKQSMRDFKIRSAGKHFMAALIAIRDGDNDPRGTARAVLEKCLGEEFDV